MHYTGQHVLHMASGDEHCKHHTVAQCSIHPATKHCTLMNQLVDRFSDGIQVLPWLRPENNSKQYNSTDKIPPYDTAKLWHAYY
jgi:hypothetical protein